MAADLLQIDCSALGACDVLRAAVDEGMNALPRWEIEVLSGRDDVDLNAAIGSPVELRMIDELEGTSRLVDLVISEIAYEGEERVGHRYSLSLSAAAAKLTLRSGYRVILDKAVQEIVPAVLREAGVPADQIVLRLSGQYTARPQCTQYDETDWAFVERLLAEEGISYWFDYDDKKQKSILVLGDAIGSHDAIAPPVELPFEDPTGLIRVRTISSLEVSEEVTSTAVTVRDFDVRNPSVYIEGSAGEGPLFHFEYPALVATADAAKARAKVRLEQLQRLRASAAGVTDCIRVQPGRIVSVVGAAGDGVNGRYLVIAQRIAYQRPSSHAAEAQPFRSEVTLVPAGDQPFRPAVPARRLIEGLETAVTTGPSGQEIHVDDLGRVKLRFPWDPAGITDDKSSAWARCLQWSMTGSMFLPRVGWEVPVAYLDGCPDRPFVLQRLYNATAVVPYPLPGAVATTAIKSATSPGGGNVNEIRMSDDAGSQQMFVHASRDQSVAVGGSAMTQVGADETHDVGLMLAQVVGGSQTHVIGASQSIDVGTDWATNVEGSTTTIVAGLQRQHVKANRGINASGLYAEVIGGIYLLTCNQSNMKVSGGFMQVNGAGCLLRAGISVSEVIAGARAERVGGPYIVTAKSSLSDSVYGVKRISSGGAATESAGGDVVTSAPLGKVEAGSVSITSPGGISINGTKVTIEASTLSAGALKLDGAFKVSGSTKIEGATVKIPAGARLG